MGKSVEFKNRDRITQLGVAIGTYRRMNGMSQEELAYRANISRTFLSTIEAPKMVVSFSIEVLFNIADALGMEPSELLALADHPEKMFIKKDEA
ncbi:MAG: helix-turn-helix domain-containing protein [Clostridia bacterium]|nr:helix-turn-helix domain-containing protein [Clostridia bacterium]